MNKKTKIIIVVAALIILLMSSIIFLKLNTGNKEKIAINYLNKKYGNGGWEILKSEDYYSENSTESLFSKKYKRDGKKLKIKSTYINNKYFYLYVNDKNMVTDDYFLPTYYSIKYNLNYEDDPDPLSEDNFDLVEKMVYISTYHYPYKDYKNSSSGWYFNKPNCDINVYLMSSFFSPISVHTSPKKEKVLDVIPDEGRIPELSEIIKLVENYYSSGRTRNKDNHEKELYDLIFKKKASEEEIDNFISNHITKVDGLEVVDYLKKN